MEKRIKIVDLFLTFIASVGLTLSVTLSIFRGNWVYKLFMVIFIILTILEIVIVIKTINQEED